MAVSPEKVPDDPLETTSPTNGYTILVVEDEAEVREVIVRHLEHAGYRVLEGPGPLQALELSRGHIEPLHLLVSDIDMPDMTGVEMAKRMLAERPGLPILFVSGASHELILEAGREHPRSAFLQKPFQIEALLQQVRELIAGQA